MNQTPTAFTGFATFDVNGTLLSLSKIPPRSESLDLPSEVNLPSRCHSEKFRGEKKIAIRLLQEQVQKVHQVDLKCMFFTKTPIFLACLNMFTATLTLLRV
jgi:hypothetical protein